MRGVVGMGQDKTMRGGNKDPILRHRPAPLPSLDENNSSVLNRIYIHYIIKVQLQKGLAFVVVDWDYIQQTLDTHNQCEINIPIFFF